MPFDNRNNTTYMHCVTAWMTTCLLSVKQLNTAGHVNLFYLKVSFHQYSIVYPFPRNILHKLLAP